MAGQVADEAGEGAQLVVVGSADAVQHGIQDALLLQRQPAQHTRPLQGKQPLGDSTSSLLLSSLHSQGADQGEPGADCGDPLTLPRPHPAVPGCDVLQGPRGRLCRVLVELTALQQPVVDAHDLWVPEPLHALGVLGDLREGDDVCVQVVLRDKGTVKTLRVFPLQYPSLLAFPFPCLPGLNCWAGSWQVTLAAAMPHGMEKQGFSTLIHPKHLIHPPLSSPLCSTHSQGQRPPPPWHHLCCQRFPVPAPPR